MRLTTKDNSWKHLVLAVNAQMDNGVNLTPVLMVWAITYDALPAR